jgi:hypothetical protein
LEKSLSHFLILHLSRKELPIKAQTYFCHPILIRIKSEALLKINRASNLQSDSFSQNIGNKDFLL